MSMATHEVKAASKSVSLLTSLARLYTDAYCLAPAPNTPDQTTLLVGDVG